MQTGHSRRRHLHFPLTAVCSHEHVISLRTELFLITLSNGHKNYLLEEIELKVKLLDKLNILIPYSIFIYGLHLMLKKLCIWRDIWRMQHAAN